jgi:hypothetical protein
MRDGGEQRIEARQHQVRLAINGHHHIRGPPPSFRADRLGRHRQIGG